VYPPLVGFPASGGRAHKLPTRGFSDQIFENPKML